MGLSEVQQHGSSAAISGVDPTQFVIRPLTAGDTENYRALRHKIRAGGDSKYFSDSFEREDQLDEQQWRDWCTEKREHCIFGTFYREALVGIMMITAQGPADSLLSEWEATWLDPKYRTIGVAKQAYEKVHQWTKAYMYEHAVVFIRDGNTRSRKIREEQGFSYLSTKHSQIWADGSVADTDLFILDLLPDCPSTDHPQARTVLRLKATLASTKHGVPFVEEAIRVRLTAL